MTALHRQAHLRRCRQHVHWNLNMWRNVMFSDESTFCFRQLDHRSKCGEDVESAMLIAALIVGGGSVMVWGGISHTGKTRLVIIGDSLNAERYRDEILQPVAIPYLHRLGTNPILQDDNAHPHGAGFIRDYLQNLGVERMEWPASSPDLNPIQHVWDQFGHAVCARVTNTTMLADLRQMLVEEWGAIPQQCVIRLVTSMRRRCQAVVAMYGSYTRYWGSCLLNE
ncbi:caspase-13-like protein [Lates japonicus]|uniref:Caspase-13-like protein n=1 Tax=Lates japonicus TaxID=270547 RepID=A0AAD3N6P1_LATJO|nr:caspase-13-like protein [Lates japonicus]